MLPRMEPLTLIVRLDDAQLSRIEAVLGNLNNLLTTMEHHIMSALDDLQAAVTAESTVIDSAVALLSGLKVQLDAAIAAGNPAALTQLSTDIGAATQKLADAVTANTPAAQP